MFTFLDFKYNLKIISISILRYTKLSKTTDTFIFLYLAKITFYKEDFENELTLSYCKELSICHKL